MSSLPPSASLARRLLRAVLPGSIVARTTVGIIALAMLVGLLFAAVGASLIHRSEQERLQARLDELLSTVESTASVACFVKDRALAREIAAGLLSNDAVAGVRILADGEVLFEELRPGEPAAGASTTLQRSRRVHSPFSASQVVGEIRLEGSEAGIRAQAWKYTRFVTLMLFLEVLLISLSVAWVVFNLVTRPIKSISDDLHGLGTRTGARLRVPAGNRRDEIGRLVGDVNALIGELSDIVDAERRLRIEREQNERRLALIFEKVDTGIFEIDAAGRLLSWNPGFIAALGEPSEPASLHRLLPQHRDRINQLIRDSLIAGLPRDADLELESFDGEIHRWIEISLNPVEDNMLQGVINDITERKRTELAAQQLATRDTLTGVLNRRGFDRSLAAAFERRTQERDLRLALLLIDLDYFKQVNDSYGHDAGDRVLCQVAAVLEQAVRRVDPVGRYGGDEFAVALVGVDGPATALHIANEIIAAIRQPIDLGQGRSAHIGASIGVALLSERDESPSGLLRRADAAMYAAKQAGRCGVQLASTPGLAA